METSEYSQVIRVPSISYLPHDYKFVDTRSSLIVQQLVRELTFAKGRILYEYWDTWNDRVVGWAAPVLAVDQAIDRHRRVGGPVARRVLPPPRLEVLQKAQSILEVRFPRMPAFAVKTIAEAAERQCWNVDRRTMETRVVNYVGHKYTNYGLELERASESSRKQNRRQIAETRVLESIVPRMREVLRSWLPEDMSGTDLAKFWHDNALFDWPEGNGQCKEEDMVISRLDLQSYGGKETIANLVVKVDSRL